MTTVGPDVAVREELRLFVQDSFLYLRPELDLKDDDDLLALGVIDSLGFVELVEQVERYLRSRVRDADITQENFGSIDAMVAYIAARSHAS
jgi:acyl carrier protein